MMPDSRPTGVPEGHRGWADLRQTPLAPRRSVDIGACHRGVTLRRYSRRDRTWERGAAPQALPAGIPSPIPDEGSL